MAGEMQRRVGSGALMGRVLKPGRGTEAGLRWLASVGPAPVEAWGVAMGWGRAAVYSHASRLQAAGWAESISMGHGAGSLIYPTRAGVKTAGVKASPVSSAPAPATWAHCVGCAWTAAWLSARGRVVRGSRELLADDFWRDELQWLERDGMRRRGHRPDLAAGVGEGAPLVPIEIELHDKSWQRLRAILALHAGWIAAGKTQAVIYVCGTKLTTERVARAGQEAGLSTTSGGEVRKTLRIELLDDVRAQALNARYPVRVNTN